MALESLKEHLTLVGSGEKASPERVLDVLLAAAANNTSIDCEGDELKGAPSLNTVRGVLRDSPELD
jgi:hypothetical protein